MNAQKNNESSKGIIACPSEFTQNCIQKQKFEYKYHGRKPFLSQARL